MDWSLSRLAASTGVAVLLMLSLSGPASVVENASFSPIAPELRSAVSQGSARVIVELRIAPGFRPEGSGSAPTRWPCLRPSTIL